MTGGFASKMTQTKHGLMIFQKKYWSRGWPPRSGWTSDRSGPSTSTGALTRKWSTNTGWLARRIITARVARTYVGRGTTTSATIAAVRAASVSASPAGKATIATPVSILRSSIWQSWLHRILSGSATHWPLFVSAFSHDCTRRLYKNRQGIIKGDCSFYILPMRSCISLEDFARRAVINRQRCCLRDPYRRRICTLPR